MAAAARQRRKEMEKKQEVVKRQQEVAKQEAGMGEDRRVWGEAGGGFFGWKHVRDFLRRPKEWGWRVIDS